MQLAHHRQYPITDQHISCLCMPLKYLDQFWCVHFETSYLPIPIRTLFKRRSSNNDFNPHIRYSSYIKPVYLYPKSTGK
ncbi:hypothetical protein TWF103_004935 [Orbilia oligospora]|nr:hypothetical protein TWF103_004935 [Orbilia oligospora]